MKGLVGRWIGKWNNGWMTEPVSQMRGSINALNPCPKTFSTGDELTFLLSTRRMLVIYLLCVCERIKSNTHWKILAQCVDKARARNASAVAG